VRRSLRNFVTTEVFSTLPEDPAGPRANPLKAPLVYIRAVSSRPVSDALAAHSRVRCVLSRRRPLPWSTMALGGRGTRERATRSCCVTFISTFISSVSEISEYSTEVLLIDENSARRYGIKDGRENSRGDKVERRLPENSSVPLYGAIRIIYSTRRREGRESIVGPVTLRWRTEASSHEAVVILSK